MSFIDMNLPAPAPSDDRVPSWSPDNNLMVAFARRTGDIWSGHIGAFTPRGLPVFFTAPQAVIFTVIGGCLRLMAAMLYAYSHPEQSN